MLTTLKNAFKIKDVRSRILFTFVMLIIVRLGAAIPTPGVNSEVFSAWFANQTANTGGALDFFNAMTGGSFTQMSILALNITPYITSSIIMQLLTIAIPKLEEMQRDGEDGRKKIREITRYVTIALALIEGLAMGISFSRAGYLTQNNIFGILVVVLSLTAGSSLVMWLGEQITEKGVGNGISVILLINIVSRIPEDFRTLFEQFVFNSSNIVTGGLAALIIIAVVVLTVVLVVYLQGGERRIPVQYSKKVVGRRMVGGQSTNIPLKVNTAGVIPIIFASSIMSLPAIIVNFIGVTPSGIWGHIINGLNSNNWCVPATPWYSIGLIIYIVLVIFFAYFYTAITFNPMEIADNMKKQGGFIPGIRPGKPTVDYLTKILNNIIFIGACGLVIVAFIPIFFNGVFGANVSFGGTSLIIIVGVVLETMKQVESMMLVRHYKGFLNED
ncbi:preprotein translocase subunit SecY [Catenibacillus scindens]|uniref:Protein translocase subunit SecY n=1 Tax=Catenibacillus scindens TaxID=673271 RepID=A0A7W8HDP2_9FIRM|nr:preprotein translocase subunit SecY [Catenibacillus scindens]MBB5265805.1 preprotein translocase subunit SecY [Catenibacillus scindens]